MTGDGLFCVGRAGGIEAAIVTHKGAEEQAVGPDGQDQEVAKRSVNTRQARSMEAQSWALFWVLSPGRPSTTTSRLGRELRWRRKLSRSRRFTRLRATARGTWRFGMARPKRARPSSFGRATKVRQPLFIRHAESRTRLKSTARVIRAARGKVSCCSPPDGAGPINSGSDSEAVTALSTAGCQHLTTVFGSHASAETVSALARDDTGLEGTLHGGRISSCDPIRAGKKGANDNLILRFLSTEGIAIDTPQGVDNFGSAS